MKPVQGSSNSQKSLYDYFTPSEDQGFQQPPTGLNIKEEASSSSSSNREPVVIVLSSDEEDETPPPPPPKKKRKISHSDSDVAQKRKIAQDQVLSKKKRKITPLNPNRTDGRTREGKLLQEATELGLPHDFFAATNALIDSKLQKEVLNNIRYSQIHGTQANLINRTLQGIKTDGAVVYLKLRYKEGGESVQHLTLESTNAPLDPEELINIGDFTSLNEDKEELSRKVEKHLIDNFQSIVEEVKREGYWRLPVRLHYRDLPSQICEIYGPKDPCVNQELFVIKKMLQEDSDLLERFCHLKIKEICSFIANFTRFVNPQSKVSLSIIKEEKRETWVTEAEVVFENERLAVFLRPIKKVQYPTILEALLKSSWMADASEHTVVRFADHRLEDNLVVRLYFKEVSYGLLSSKILQKGTNRLNFWEDLAFNWRKRDKNNFALIETVKRSLHAMRSTKPVILDENIKKHAIFGENIDQTDFIRFILKNQRSGIGTLLNLPTGFGKTFIIFLSVLQLSKELGKGKNKPYLVVVPAVNVMESWKDNHEILKKKLIRDHDFSFQNVGDLQHYQKKDVFLNALKNGDIQKAQFVVITQILLGNIVRFFLSPEKELKILEEHLEWLKLTRIVSDKHFIVGDRDFWDKEIKELLIEHEDVSKKVLSNFFADFSDKPKEFFYPVSNTRRGMGLDINLVKNNRSTFIKALKNVKEPSLEFLPLRLKNKICQRDDDNNVQINWGMLFDYAHVGYRSNSQEIARTNELQDLIEKVSKKQKNLIKEHEEFKALFDGIIIDESDQVLVTEDKNSIYTDVLIDITKTFQSRSFKDNPNNPLIIASSATPWPNGMKELKQHLNLLLTKLMGQHHHLNEDLFAQWSSYEAHFDKFSDNAPEIKSLAKSFHVVEQHFHRWVRLLFEATVSFEPPKAGLTNNITESEFYVDCSESCFVPAGSNTIHAIKKFYSKVLKQRSKTRKQILEILKSEDGLSTNIREQVLKILKSEDELSTNMREQVLEILKSEDELSTNTLEQLSEILKLEDGLATNMQKEVLAILDKDKHFAFFVEEQKNAAYLANLLTKHYKDKWGLSVQIGLFYEEGFVKDQAGVNKEYENVTFNTKRMVNINAFNNIFRFEDLFEYLKQHFGILQIEKQKNSIRSLVETIKGNRTSESKRNDPFTDLEKKIKKKKPLDNSEQEIHDLINLLLVLEEKSRMQIIRNFSDELIPFIKFIDGEKNKELLELFRKTNSETIKKLRLTKKNKKSAWNSPLKEFKAAVFHYLEKIHLSKVLIFGNAGTSGMRIDADNTVLLSGAWTEGKRGQIIGRHGRHKEDGGSRHCTVHLPITDTKFEFFTLRYYIRKALYHHFITSKDCPTFQKLFEQLLLVSLLGKYYNEINIKDENAVSFLERSIHTKIKELMAQSKQYLTLGAFEKAQKIIPETIAQALAEFEQQHLNEVIEELSVLRASLPIPVESEELPVALLPFDGLISEVDTDEEFLLTSSESSNMGKSGRSTLTRSYSQPQRPKIVPKIDLLIGSDWSEDELKKVKEKIRASDAKKIAIVMVPTRGKSGDLTTKEFTSHIQESVNKDFFTILIFGVNGGRTKEEPLTFESFESLEYPNLYVKYAPFAWYEEDKFGKNPPIGQMRNYCLERAKRVWQELVDENSPIEQKERIYLISMDGDTQLTKASFSHVLSKVEEKRDTRYAIATGGYTFDLEETAWAECANRISMWIKSYSVTEEKPFMRYYGYLSEPLIILSKRLTARLFKDPRKRLFYQAQKEAEAPFGFWDCEGRKLQEFLNTLVKGQLDSYGPSDNKQKMPILKNYHRFVKEGPSFSIKTPLSKDQLIGIITALHRQPQHTIKPWLTGSNIADHHGLSKAPVRRFAAHFYAKTVVALLNLGPERGIIFFKKITQLYRSNKIEFDDQDKSTFGVEEVSFKCFVRKNFGENQADKVADSSSKQPRQEFKKYAFLLSFWARNVFEALGKEFGRTYQGELDDKGRYIPMAHPKEYPKEAERILAQDEKMAEEEGDNPFVVDEKFIDGVVESLRKDHFIPFDASSELKALHPEIVKVGAIFKNSLLLLVLNFSNISSNETRTLCQIILNKTKAIYKKSFPSEREIALCFAENDEGIDLKYGDQREDEFSFSDEPREELPFVFNLALHV